MDYSHNDINSSTNYDDESHVRQRRVDLEDVDHSDAGVYKELERLRGLVDVIEGERSGGRHGGGIASCFPMTVDNNVMSTVFGLVFFTIITVTVYAFHNLFRAISKRFFEERESV